MIMEGSFVLGVVDQRLFNLHREYTLPIIHTMCVIVDTTFTPYIGHSQGNRKPDLVSKRPLDHKLPLCFPFTFPSS